MRAFAGNFDEDELRQAVAYAHQRGVKVHCTINTMPRNDEIARLPAHLELLNDAGVDALIVADMGAFTLAGKYAPGCARHISTQASIVNYQSARAWYELGASRVILARELSLDEIREIRAKSPKGAGDRGLRPRRHVRQLLRAVPAVQLHDRPGLQPRGLRPALPLSVCPDGGEAARGVLPGL